MRADIYEAENLLSFQTKPDDPVEKLITTCGTVQAHLKIKLVDENGATVPIGVPGEVWTAGYSVCKGYVTLDFGNTLENHLGK